MTTGRQRFLDSCRRHGLEQSPYGNRAACSRPVDADVRSFLEETGGGQFAMMSFSGPGDLAERSETAAYGRPDLPWLRELTFFAKWQRTNYHLASIPTLGDATGRQPILYVDLHESTQIVPIASRGDLAFLRLAEHIDAHLSRGRELEDEPFFPESVADAISADLELQTLIATGRLAQYSAR